MHDTKYWHILNIIILAVVTAIVGVLIAKTEVFGLLKPNSPRLMTTVKSHDFGSVSPLQDLEYVFTFRNTGRKPLQIQKIHTSCGCTAGILNSEIIQPGKEGKLKVKFKVGRWSGKEQEQVILHTDDPSHPVSTFTVMANVVSIFELHPHFIDFGIVERDALPIEREIMLLPGTSGYLHGGLKASSDTDNLFVSIEKLTTEGQYRLKVTLKTDVPVGPIRGNILLELSQPKSYTMMLPIRGKVVGNVYAVPETLFFGIVKPGIKVERQAKIISRVDTYTLNIKDIANVTNDKITAYLEKNLDGYRLFATLYPKGEDRKISGVIRIEANSKDFSILEVPVLAFLSKEMEFKESSIDGHKTDNKKE